MLTIEGLQINVTVTALQQGDGFLVRVTTSWDIDKQHQKALRLAQREGLIGRIVNTHEASYADAQKTVVSAVTAFEEDVKAFLEEYNA